MLLNSKKRKRSLLMTRLMCCLSSLYLANTHADEFDTFQFSTSVNRTWDNNLFRLSDNERSDQITTYSAGVKFDKRYSLQRFIVNVNYLDYKYQRNDFLNFDTINYDATWQWSLSPSLTGTLLSSRTRALNGFGDFRLLTQNIRTNATNQFRAEYSPYKVGALIAGFTETRLENSQTFNAQTDFDATAFDYGARYNFPSGTNMTLLGHKRQSHYSNRVLSPILLFDNGYSEDEFEFDIVFKATGKSNLSSKLAHLSREYDNYSVRDYGVWYGNIKYDLFLTGKLKTSFDFSRVVGAFESSYSTYTVTDAVSVNTSYFVSEKLILSVNGRYAKRDFKQAVVPDRPSRNDDERSIGAAVTWQPVKSVSVIVNTTKSSRDASSAYNQFDYNDVTSSLTLDLKI
ncbi:XrtB/PEP-CTERM-associated polysaccharide biosynthesis outer membrane protein EpsL [Methylophilus glucosoxydans]|uniref:XrtB/PEP-CTERM-associated polysaccharide biosynthesis outer membrane protein EpsL n=1 Tax=Methylophilus glucosoxydans TaxID=752553 RepID=A0ABW3GI31_9PROT